MAHKTLINGTAYTVKGGRDLIAGTGYAKKQGKTLIDGTEHAISFGIPLNTITPGAILYLNESGNPVPFYIAKHDYESGLNGAGRTLVVRRDCYTRVQFSSGKNDYATSTLCRVLDEYGSSALDADTRALIETTKFYYTQGTGGSLTTLQKAVFQLSLAELGGSATGVEIDGEALPIASTLQIAYFNGSTNYQWTRTPSQSMRSQIYAFTDRGKVAQGYYNNSLGSRPAFTLPGTLGLAQNPDGTYTLAT